MTVSIIMPVYKVSDYIENCMQSVLAQTYSDLECLIVDDATPDDSIAKCERMIADYQGPVRFTILHHEHNRGLSAARNTGTAAATGDYVFYLDSDDELPVDSIAKLVRPVLNDPSIEMVTGLHQRFPDAQQQQYPTSNEQEYKTSQEVRRYAFSQKSRVFAWNKLIKREFLNRNHLHFEEGLLWEDILWDFYLLKRLSHLYTLPEVTYHYRQRPHSISTGTTKTDRSPHLDVIYSTIADHLTEGDRGREVHNYYKGFCGYFLRHINDPEARRRAKTFRDALKEGNDTKQARQLSLLILMAETSLGRAAITVGHKMVKSLA